MRPRPLSLSCRVSKRCRIAMCTQFIFVLLPARSETATAANPVIRCRCGMPFSAAPFQHAFWTACRSPLYRNGSRFRDSVPLWCAIFRRTLSACLLDGIVVRPFTATAAACLLDGIVVRPFAATAAKPVIRCRCGKPAPASFSLRSFPRWKVPVEMAFCHHLLIFVISGSASEVALGDPAPVSCGEGAG